MTSGNYSNTVDTLFCQDTEIASILPKSKERLKEEREKRGRLLPPIILLYKSMLIPANLHNRV